MSMDNTHEAHPGRVPRISIAMTTYNSTKYLSEQLESIARQDVLPFEVVICDDGSTDDTYQIIENFRETAPFPVQFIKNEVNLGFAENFLKAARLCRGDWISFCDHDDVWLPNKLRNAGAAIQKNESAILILQNAILSDSELKSQGRLFPNYIKPGVHGPGRQYGYWVWHGFLQTFRADIIRDLNSTDRPSFDGDDTPYSHDQWISLIANSIGDIVVLDEPVAIYRRHASALTENYQLRNIKERISNALQISSTHYESRSCAAHSSACYLREAAASCKSKTWQQRLTVAATEFDKIAAIQALRAQIYYKTNIFSRLRSFIRILASRGYWGPPMIALGARSAAKDLTVVLGVVRQPTHAKADEIPSAPP